MNTFNAARKPLKMHESQTISRAPLRLLESPWQRTPLRCIDETFAGAAGNLAARGLGAVFNTQGHRLRKAASARDYRDQMRRHYSDSPGALAHLNPEFEKQAADQSQKATHGRFSRLIFGDPTKHGDSSSAPSTTTSHTPPTVTATHAASPTASAPRPAVASNATVTPRATTPMGNPAHPQGAANRAALLGGKPKPAPEKPLDKLDTSKPPADPEGDLARAKAHAMGQAPTFAGSNLGKLKAVAQAGKKGPEAGHAPGGKPGAASPATLGAVTGPAIAKLRGIHKKDAEISKSLEPAMARIGIHPGGKAPESKPASTPPSQSDAPKQKLSLGNVMAQLSPEQKAKANAQAAANKAAKTGKTIAGGNIKGKVEKAKNMMTRVRAANAGLDKGSAHLRDLQQQGKITPSQGLAAYRAGKKAIRSAV